MALSVEALIERQKYIGSSDVPALLGLSPYKNLGDLWLEKTGRLEVAQTPSPAADWGDRLEPVLCHWVGEALGEEVVRGEYRRSSDDLLRAQLDGWLASSNETVEVKTSGLFSPMFRADEDGWGADGTDEVPYRVIAQVQFALMLAGSPRGHVAAFLGNGVGPRHYVVEAMPALQREIETRARAFWEHHVLADIAPQAIPSIDTLKLVKREEGKTVSIDEELAFQYGEAEAAAKESSKAKDDAKAAVLDAMGDADTAITPFGTFTYHANKNGVRTLRFKGAS